MKSYTVFTTYALAPSGNTIGFNQAIHCNYIKSLEIETTSISIQEFRFYFDDSDDFKFLNDSVSNEIGFMAQKIYVLLQLVEHTGTTTTVEPVSSNWKMYDVTDQISGYVEGQLLSASDLTGVVFRVPLLNYDTYTSYTLNYLTYPTSAQTTNLCFGDEDYFFGNVSTTIKAHVYTTDITINLPLNEFNSTDNETWDGLSSVYITEIGIYDGDYNLVAIGKLNKPMRKDSMTSRTISFSIDF